MRGGYSKISAKHFGCSTARNKGTCANWRDSLEATVLKGLKEHLRNPDLFKEFADKFIRELNRLRGSKERAKTDPRNEPARFESEINRIFQGIAEGLSASGRLNLITSWVRSQPTRGTKRKNPARRLGF